MSDRLTKSEAEYRSQTEEERQADERCGTCSMFVGGGQCTEVIGAIDPDRHLCKLYEPRNGR